MNDGYLSKSVYETSDTHRTEDKLKNVLTNNSEMKLELPILSKHSLFVDKEQYKRYELNKIFLDFEEYMKKLNYKQLNAPFITNTFHVQRKMAFAKFEKLTKTMDVQDRCLHMKKFIEKIDVEYFNQFKYQIKESYVDLVFQKHYNIPKNLNIDDVKKTEAVKELYNLSVIVAIWTIEIETAADLIERANLYGLYYLPEEKKEVVEKLKTENQYQNKFTVKGFTRVILKRAVMGLMDKLSSNLMSKGFNFKSISYSACVGILYYIIGQSAFPWYFVVGSVNIPWICGGFLASKLLEKLGKKITRDEVLKDLTALESVMNENAIELIEINKIIEDTIKKSYEASTELEFEFFKGTVKLKIESLFEYKRKKEDLQSKPYSGTLSDSRLSLDMLVVKEPDDPQGWVICDMEDYEKVDDGVDEEDYILY
jgi:hypothetical protein